MVQKIRRYLAEKSSDLKGKVVLLDFWAMWCTTCQVSFPHWRELKSKYGDKGLEIVGVTRFYGRSDKQESLSPPQELQSLYDFKNKQSLTYPIAIGRIDDVTNEERFGITGLPTVILIGRQGNIRFIRQGVGDYRELERKIVQLLSEN